MVQLQQTKKTLEKRADSSGGQSIVEILVAVGLMAVLLPAILTGFVASRESKPQEQNRVKAVGLIRELEESIKSIRENDWDNISTNIVMESAYHPEVSGSSWVLMAGTENADGFTRQIVFSNVQRDSSGVIVGAGGTNDPSTKMAVSTVSWAEPIASSVESTTYLSRYISNAAWEQTTQAEFDAGSLIDVVTTNNSGGEVELDAGGGGDWASPTIEDTYNNGGNANAFDIYVEGNYAYLTTSNNSGNPDLAVVNVSNPASITTEGSINLGTTVRAVHVQGNYAYLATVHNTQELMIVDVSDKANPSKRGTVNLGDRGNAWAIFTLGDYAYVGMDSRSASAEFYVVDVSDPNNPQEVGSLEIGSDVRDVYVIGNYAYLATHSNSNELAIIDISTPTAPTYVGGYNANSGANGYGVFVVGTTAYLTTRNNAGGSDPEFYILDVADPGNINLIGSYDVADNANKVHAMGNLAFIASENPIQELIILDIRTPSSPALYGSADLSADANAVFALGDYAYVASDSDTEELTVVGGGLPYVPTGAYESQTFDAGSEVAFNYLAISYTEPSSTDIKLQIALNNDGSTWNYIGPDGTSGSYYEGSGAISLDSTLGQYFRVQATFDGGFNTPTLKDFSINYSP